MKAPSGRVPVAALNLTALESLKGLMKAQGFSVETARKVQDAIDEICRIENLDPKPRPDRDRHFAANAMMEGLLQFQQELDELPVVERAKLEAAIDAFGVPSKLLVFNVLNAIASVTPYVTKAKSPRGRKSHVERSVQYVGLLARAIKSEKLKPSKTEGSAFRELCEYAFNAAGVNKSSGAAVEAFNKPNKGELSLRDQLKQEGECN